jgi:hypothetical protein
MTSTDRRALTTLETDVSGESDRFELIFKQPPTPSELARSRRLRSGLLLRLPGSVRRRAALLITR